jgi:tRNA (guanine37-N1)-methyltransferase
LEYPHYTRPEVFEEMKVPDILLSGNHQEIKKWRFEQSVEKTKKLRPEGI